MLNPLAHSTRRTRLLPSSDQPALASAPPFIWALVRGIHERGKTVFLTTHFMEEAERLCDRVAIIDHGKIIALDAPQNLIRNLGAESRVIFETEEKFDPSGLASLAA